jgi:adenylate kinase
MGPQGSGKDTQASLLAQNHGFTTLSTGQLLRTEIAHKSEIGLKLEALLDQGQLAPDDIIFQILEQNLVDPKDKNYALNAVVRTVAQIPFLDTLLEKKGAKMDKVLLLELSDDTALERLANRWYCPVDQKNYHTIYDPPKNDLTCDLCGTKLIQRDDDKPDAIRQRLKLFHDNAADIINVYRERGILVTVDATPSISDVAKMIEDYLDLKDTK